jgi:DNA-3-methyladenine glycosylase II
LPAEFRVALSGPLDVPGSLELFRRSGDDLIDRWDGQRFLRAVPIDSVTWAPVVATLVGSAAAPAFDVVVGDTAHVEAVRQAVATSLVPAPADYQRLLSEDPVIARFDALFPGIRQIRQLDLFTALVRCISAQQVNLRWAVTTRRRLAEAFGRRYAVGTETVYALDPVRIAAVDPPDIRALQFTTSKSVSIVAVAQTLVRDGLTAEVLAGLPDDEVIARLTAIKGIGRWSAEWVLARTLGRGRVVAGDLGVRKAVGLAYLNNPLPSEQEVRDLTRHWGESASVAQAVLLQALGEGALTVPPKPPGSRAASRA